MNDLVPWAIRYGTAIALGAVPLLVAVSFFIAYVYIRVQFRRRVRIERQFDDKPVSDSTEQHEGGCIVATGRLICIAGGKLVANGTILLDVNGNTSVDVQSFLCLERGSDRIALIGPFLVRIGSRESVPSEKGRRVLCAGDQVIVDGRWSLDHAVTTSYREVVTKTAIVPSHEVLDIAYAGVPSAIGLSRRCIKPATTIAAFLLCAIFVGFAEYAFQRAKHKVLMGSDSDDRLIFDLAALACFSPVTRAAAEELLLREAANPVVRRDSDFAERYAAVEVYFTGHSECRKTLRNLHSTGNFAQEARIGLACGGISSRRKAAAAFVQLGDFPRAAEVLRDAPVPNDRERGDENLRLDLRVALVTGDLLGVAKMLRTYGHSALSQTGALCLALSFEARTGSKEARTELSSLMTKERICTVIYADLLDGQERLTVLDALPDTERATLAWPILNALRLEADPTKATFHFQFSDSMAFLAAPTVCHSNDVPSAIWASALVRAEALANQGVHLRQVRANLQAELGSAAAQVGDEAEAQRLATAAASNIPDDELNVVDIRRLRAAIALRFSEPNPSSYLDQFASVAKHPLIDRDFMLMKSVVDIRNGRGQYSDYYKQFYSSFEVATATRMGAGESISNHLSSSDLLRHLIVVGALMQTGREVLIDEMRWYADPEREYDQWTTSEEKRAPCSFDFLAGHAASRALAIRNLRAREIGKGDDQQALEERARKLREPVARRDIAVALMLLANTTRIDW